MQTGNYVKSFRRQPHLDSRGILIRVDYMKDIVSDPNRIKIAENDGVGRGRISAVTDAKHPAKSLPDDSSLQNVSSKRYHTRGLSLANTSRSFFKPPESSEDRPVRIEVSKNGPKTGKGRGKASSGMCILHSDFTFKL